MGDRRRHRRPIPDREEIVVRRIRAVILRVAALFGVGRTNDEIAEELKTHIALLATELERSGMAPPAARRAAALKFGSISATEDAYRDRRGLPRVEPWFRDVRYAVRSLGRSALLTLSVVVVLGCGIGASTAIVTMLHATVWRPLPVRDADRVVKLSLALQGKFSRHVVGSPSRFSFPEFQSYRDATHVLSGVAALQEQRLTWRGQGEPRALDAALVTGNYFDVLRVEAARGRLLADADTRAPIVVISDRLWQDTFGRDPEVIGRTMNLDRSGYEVVGVAEPGFRGTEFTPVDVWLPLETATIARGNAAQLTETGVSWLQLVGRLANDQPIVSANAEAATIAASFDVPYPGRHSTIVVTPASRLDAGLTNSRDRPKVLVMYGAVGALVVLLLFLSASNAAGLLLARGASRRKEIAVRMAIGAGRGQILRQLFVESLVIALSSAALGLVVCTWTLRGVAHSLLPLQDVFERFTPDGAVFGFAAVFAGVASLFIGVGPSLQALEVDVLSALKGGSGDTAGAMLRLPAARLRHLLISAQTAISAVLLIIAALLARGIDRASRIDPGFTTTDVYVLSLDPSRGDAAIERSVRRTRDFRERLERMPGVLAVGAAGIMPFKGQGVASFRTGDMPSPVTVSFNTVDEGYFRALGVATLAGRLFGPQEGPDAVLINDSFARASWHNAHEALGSRLLLPDGSGYQTSTVIGVIPTLQSVNLGVPDGPTYYAPIRDDRVAQAAFVVHVSAGTPLERLVREGLRSIDPDAVISIDSMSARIAMSAAPSRMLASLAALVGVVALIMAAIGIHGIVAYSVACRTRDISVHVALGAPRLSVVGLVLRSSLRAAAIGGLTGGVLVVAPAIALSKVLTALLFGLSPLDPGALFAGAVVLTGATLLAAYIPARRALHIRPIDALRQDG
jgi:putative ABC transport system permease protein